MPGMPPVIFVDSTGALPVPALQQAGVSGVIRYVGGGTWKRGTTQELARYRAAGLVAGLVWEAGTSNALAGRAQGVADARTANAQADSIGYPADAALYWSVDTSATWNQVRAYAQGWASATTRPVGVYGPGDVLRGGQREGLVRYGWLAGARGWPGSRDTTGAHLIQEVGPQQVPGYSTDRNTVVAPTGLWGHTANPPAQEDLTVAQLDQLIAAIREEGQATRAAILGAAATEKGWDDKRELEADASLLGVIRQEGRATRDALRTLATSLGHPLPAEPAPAGTTTPPAG